jgi:GntR family transcriptional regulator
MLPRLTDTSASAPRHRPGRGRTRYDELALLLEGRIVGGILTPGERLPSEAELCAEFNLSRVTVRKSLAVLAAAGLVHTRHGQGTFVADPLPRRVAAARSLGPTYMGFIDDLKIEGLLAPMTVLDRKELQPDPDTVDRLGIAPTERVVRFRWVRSHQNTTVAYGIDHVTADIGGRMTLDDVRTCPSLVEAFERAGAFPTENIQSLTPVLANDDVARRLRVDVASPVVQIDGVGLDRHGAPFESYRLWLAPGYHLQLRFIRIAKPHPAP